MDWPGNIKSIVITMSLTGSLNGMTPTFVVSMFCELHSLPCLAWCLHHIILVPKVSCYPWLLQSTTSNFFILFFMLFMMMRNEREEFYSTTFPLISLKYWLKTPSKVWPRVWQGWVTVSELMLPDWENLPFLSQDKLKFVNLFEHLL